MKTQATLARIDVASPAFENGKVIPRQYTADGKNVSPPLRWSNPPGGTRSFVIICEDPDAPSGVFLHWLAFNIPGDARGMSEGIPIETALDDGTIQAKNDFGGIGYGGPRPPPGKPHRYYFRVHALDRKLTLAPTATREEVEDAMTGHLLGKGETMGRYER